MTADAFEYKLKSLHSKEGTIHEAHLLQPPLTLSRGCGERILTFLPWGALCFMRWSWRWTTITKWTDGLTDLEVHTEPLGLPPVAFHLRHIAASVDRILTYAEGGQLSAEQLSALKAEQIGPEHDERETLAALLAEVEVSFSNASERIRILATADFNTFRGVGRKQLPTSIGGALIHVADHTQRHAGQVVTTAKVLKALRA